MKGFDLFLQRRMIPTQLNLNCIVKCEKFHSWLTNTNTRKWNLLCCTFDWTLLFKLICRLWDARMCSAVFLIEMQPKQHKLAGNDEYQWESGSRFCEWDTKAPLFDQFSMSMVNAKVRRISVERQHRDKKKTHRVGVSFWFSPQNFHSRKN